MITGPVSPVFTVKVAVALAAVPAALLNFAEYFPAEPAKAVKVKLVVVAPDMAEVPKYHCTVEGLPLADAVKVTGVPAMITWLTGDMVMTGGSITVSTATALVAVPYELLNTAV